MIQARLQDCLRLSSLSISKRLAGLDLVCSGPTPLASADEEETPESEEA